MHPTGKEGLRCPAVTLGGRLGSKQTQRAIVTDKRRMLKYVAEYGFNWLSPEEDA